MIKLKNIYIKNIDKKSRATRVDLINSRPGITPKEGKGKK